MSFTLHGVGVSGGIAIGHAHLVSHVALEVAHYVLPQNEIGNETARLDAAFTLVRAELESLHASVASGPAAAEYGAFLDLHRMILDDSTLSVAAKIYITQNQCNAEWALTQQMDVLLAQFEQIEDAYLRERKTDVVQVVERVLKALLGHPGYVPPPVQRDGDSILVAHDLSPADVIQYKQHHFTAFLTDLGGLTSHTAIVARSLNIPSIVALHHARQLIRDNDLLIVDGSQGVVIVDPDEHVLSEYRLRQSQLELEKRKLKRIKTTAATTLDGSAVELFANIELPQDIEQVKENGATGIGLFRSEFLFLNRDDLPSEDEQFEAYRTVARKMHGLPVTIRTFDLGADKNLDSAKRVAVNPALGLRAIRLSLAEPQMFHTQLRAILRASAHDEETQEQLGMMQQCIDRISKTVMAKGLDAGTAFEILSIDIADVDVGKNIGAELQTDQAEADKRIAQAKAEERRALAVAVEQEYKAEVVRERAKLVAAEASIPLAIAEAFKRGQLGVMDYQRYRNIEADTTMRNALAAGEGGEQPGPKS